MPGAKAFGGIAGAQLSTSNINTKMDRFSVIIVEDVPLELKGTEGILRTDIPEADVIGRPTANPATGSW